MPLPAGCNLDVLDETPVASCKLPYRRIVGALLWVALATPPDILFATVYLTRFLCAYDHTHFNAARHVLAYLSGTSQQTIRYQHMPNNDLFTISHQSISLPFIHTDASHGTDKCTAKSYSGIIACLASGPIAWASHLQSVVSLSSTEAKLITLTDAVHQAIYMCKLYKTFSFSLDDPMPIYCDNQSTLKIAVKPPYAPA
jgi:hypothetical protein